MPPLIQDLLMPVFLIAIWFVFGGLALRSTTGGGEIGPKGKVYLFRGALILLPILYGAVAWSYGKELGFTLLALLLSLFAWLAIWQLFALIRRIQSINREQEALLARGELKLIPLRPAQKVVNIVLVVWGSVCIVGAIIALVLKALR
jgi:hypothetical protein